MASVRRNSSEGGGEAGWYLLQKLSVGDPYGCRCGCKQGTNKQACVNQCVGAAALVLSPCIVALGA
jgi:hypothetical protein